jgi:hypothetical protein
MENFNAEIKLLTALAKIELCDNDNIIIEKLIDSKQDWEILYKYAVFHGIAALISRHLSCQKNIESIPKKIFSDLYQHYLLSLSRNIILYEHFQKILQSFSAKNISVIPLKGIFLAEKLYKDIGLRQMSDIDLLVKKDNAETCIQILLNLGYLPFGVDKTKFFRNNGVAKHMPTMVLNDILVDIHFKIQIDDTIHTIDMEEYWRNATSINLYNIKTLALSTENLLLYLCIHIERHFNEGKIQLYQFVDMIGILQTHEKDFNWSQFEFSCEKNYCKKNVLTILFFLYEFFSIELPEKIVQQFSVFNFEKSKALFISFLNCNIEEILNRTENQNIKNLRKIKGTKNKFFYLFGDIFPSKLFMYNRYRIKHKPFLFIYYLLRINKGFIALLKHFIKIYKK